MININLDNLKINVYNLEKLINEYEIVKLNLFNQLKKSCISWQDNNSLKFEDILVSEKNETELVIENIKLQADIFMKIYNDYSRIGNCIKANLNNKTHILNLINNLILKTESIEKQIDNINNSITYDLKLKLKNIKNGFYSLRDYVKKLYNNIENIEFSLNRDLSKLEKIKIKMIEV